jgi:hypothetical protein
LTAVETTKERWCEAEISRIAGEIVLKSARAGRSESGKVFRACARGSTSTTSKILGTPRRYEHGAALARPGQAGRGSRPARSVYGWFTEGFDTLDLKEAKALLDELSS